MLGIKPLTGKARAAYNDPLRRLTIYDGSVRSGKTITSLFRWCRWVRYEAPPGLLLLAGYTEQTARQNIVDPLIEIFGKSVRYTRPYMYLFGRRVLVVGAHDERSAGRIRGLTLAGAYGDELTLWPESFFTMLLSRLSVEGATFLGTTNPDTPAHWLMKKYLKREGVLNLKRWHFILEDNPNLPKEYIEDLKKEYVGLWYDRYILGLWKVAEGAIFDMLDPERHLVQDLPFSLTERARMPLASWAGGDYGTTNATVFLVLSQGADRFYVHNEYRYDSREVGRQKTNAEYSRDFFAWKKKHGYPLKSTLVDPAANSFILQLWRDAPDGEKSIGPGDNTVNDGLREVATLLGENLLVFHEPTTEPTWEEMVGYVWDPKAQEHGIDAPMKINDHGPDALRYVVRGTRSVWKHYLHTGGSRAAA